MGLISPKELLLLQSEKAHDLLVAEGLGFPAVLLSLGARAFHVRILSSLLEGSDETDDS